MSGTTQVRLVQLLGWQAPGLPPCNYLVRAQMLHDDAVCLHGHLCVHVCVRVCFVFMRVHTFESTERVCLKLMWPGAPCRNQLVLDVDLAWCPVQIPAGAAQRELLQPAVGACAQGHGGHGRRLARLPAACAHRLPDAEASGRAGVGRCEVRHARASQ